jgi:hypothetical protein
MPAPERTDADKKRGFKRHRGEHPKLGAKGEWVAVKDGRYQDTGDPSIIVTKEERLRLGRQAKIKKDTENRRLKREMAKSQALPEAEEEEDDPPDVSTEAEALELAKKYAKAGNPDLAGRQASVIVTATVESLAAEATQEVRAVEAEIFNAGCEAHKDVRKGQSVIHGAGLFAHRCVAQGHNPSTLHVHPSRLSACVTCTCRNLKEGQSLGRVRGLVLSTHATQAAAAAVYAGRKFVFCARRAVNVAGWLAVDAEQSGNDLRFMNDVTGTGAHPHRPPPLAAIPLERQTLRLPSHLAGRQASVIVTATLEMKTLRQVKRGEELLFEYGDLYGHEEAPAPAKAMAPATAKAVAPAAEAATARRALIAEQDAEYAESLRIDQARDAEEAAAKEAAEVAAKAAAEAAAKAAAEAAATAMFYRADNRQLGRLRDEREQRQWRLAEEATGEEEEEEVPFAHTAAEAADQAEAALAKILTSLAKQAVGSEQQPLLMAAAADEAVDLGDDPRALLQRRVEVRWRGDLGEPWYSGVISWYNDKSHLHIVTYDDGDTKAHDLAAEVEAGQLRWLGDAVSTEHGPLSFPHSFCLALLSVTCSFLPRPSRSRACRTRTFVPSAGTDRGSSFARAAPIAVCSFTTPSASPPSASHATAGAPRAA